MPDAQFFDSVKFSIKKLRHNLRSKAVLCPGLAVNFKNEIDETEDNWLFEDGIKDYLQASLDGLDCVQAPHLLFLLEPKKSSLIAL